MKILVLARSEFQHVEYTDKVAFISIHNPNVDSPIFPDSENVLNLWFDDVEEDYGYELLNGDRIVYFNDFMADKIYKFVKLNESKKGFVIHCTMGKCRSGAVGSVLVDYFQIPYLEFLKLNPRVQPNILVKKLLTERFFGNSFEI